MNETAACVRKALFEMQDIKYKDFQSKLIPNIAKEKIIGIRTPILKKFAKDFFKDESYKDFISDLPHVYYDENNLHGFLIEQIKDFDEAILQVEKFLPYIDNWATCDLMRPKAFKNNKEKLYEKIKMWIVSDDTYTVRFAIEMLMTYYLDDGYKDEYAHLVSLVKSDEYYINMMIAWYFATALSKQYDSVLPYIEENRLDKWTHNKTIQKALESFRITDEQKVYLRSLKKK